MKESVVIAWFCGNGDEIKGWLPDTPERVKRPCYFDVEKVWLDEANLLRFIEQYNREFGPGEIMALTENIVQVVPLTAPVWFVYPELHTIDGHDMTLWPIDMGWLIDR